MEAGAEHYFRIGRTATQIDLRRTASAAELFARQGALLCRRAMAPDLLTQLATAATRAPFVANPVMGLGHRWIEQPVRVGAAIETAINRPALCHWLAAVTGHGDVGLAEGRLVETRPGGIDGLSWHDDRIPEARLGVTLHLRDCAYTGGAFELRRKRETALLFRHDAAQAGDVVIFDVGTAHEHRVLPVTEGAARLVYTGWFMLRA